MVVKRRELATLKDDWCSTSDRGFGNKVDLALVSIWPISDML